MNENILHDTTDFVGYSFNRETYHTTNREIAFLTVLPVLLALGLAVISVMRIIKEIKNLN